MNCRLTVLAINCIKCRQHRTRERVLTGLTVKSRRVLDRLYSYFHSLKYRCQTRLTTQAKTTCLTAIDAVRRWTQAVSRSSKRAEAGLREGVRAVFTSGQPLRVRACIQLFDDSVGVLTALAALNEVFGLPKKVDHQACA